eukprot:257951-Rhodomonas_salina.3
MSGTDVAYRAMSLRACYAVPGTEVAYGATSTPGTDMACGATRGSGAYSSRFQVSSASYTVCLASRRRLIRTLLLPPC